MVCDTRALSDKELRNLTAAIYRRAWRRHWSAHRHSPAPDLYRNAQTMAIIYDTYSMMHPGENNLPVVTGKPVHMGGSEGRFAATAQGLLYATQELIELGVVERLSSLSGASVAVQGYGNAGRNAARPLRRGWSVRGRCLGFPRRRLPQRGP